MGIERARTPYKCSSCVGLRPIGLHLHELSRYCDMLGNERMSSSMLEGLDDARSSTSGIAKWLLSRAKSPKW